ncbi:MAG: PTS IIA-like nitrogen regulatory protein PtsN [Gammaproteobacteria bacterium]|nr:MAG: PTS IIA-like nitrogen regulatory protein PtsN [Gammaproteobacteria bacterium]
MLAKLLKVENIFCHQNLQSKKQILDKISSFFASKINTHSKTDILNYLLTREKIGSTALGEGVAMPHVSLPDIQKPSVMFISLKNSIDYDAPDKKPIDLLFAALIPKDGDKNYSYADDLYGISDILSEHNKIKILRDTDDKQIIIDTFYEQ